MDQTRRPPGNRQFPATAAGYQALLEWLRSFGRVATIGVEGTGSYGAGLARSSPAPGSAWSRSTARTARPAAKGKSDPIDAIAAARAAVSGRPPAPRKPGPARSRLSAPCGWAGSAVKARTAAYNQLHGLITAAPENLRAQLRPNAGPRCSTPAGTCP